MPKKKNNPWEGQGGPAPSGEPNAVPLTDPDNVLWMRLEFLHRNFTNTQELITFMDQKAGHLLTAVGVLSATLGVLAMSFFNIKPTPTDIIGVRLQTSGAIVLIIYFLLLFLAILKTLLVVMPRKVKSTVCTDVAGLIFPLMVLESCHGDPRTYVQKVAGITYNELLHEYADQVVSVAEIYKLKHERLDDALVWLRAAIFAWGCAILMTLLLAAYNV
jgi:hypothetical protein